jgi:hypothetical protein
MCESRRSRRRAWTSRRGVAVLRDGRGHRQGGRGLRCAAGPGERRVGGLPDGLRLARGLARRWVGCLGRGAIEDPARVRRQSQDRSALRGAAGAAAICWRAARRAVPGAEEALGDLVRAREAVCVDLMRCSHRLSKLMLRHWIRFDDGPAWTRRPPRLAGSGRARVPGRAGDAARLPSSRSTRSPTAATGASTRSSPCRLAARGWQVSRLRCLRGVDRPTAVGRAYRPAASSGSPAPRS